MPATPCRGVNEAVLGGFGWYDVPNLEVYAWYDVPMSVTWARVSECDVCGHKWLPEGDKLPDRCPSRSCRSTKWNQAASPASPVPPASPKPTRPTLPPTSKPIQGLKRTRPSGLKRTRPVIDAILAQNPSVRPASSLLHPPSKPAPCPECGSIMAIHQRWCSKRGLPSRS